LAVAVYTDVPPPALAAFLADYDLGAPLALEGIAEGVENSNFRLRTERGTYILTVYEKRVDPADLPFFLGLMEHLARQGVPCPLPVRARDGEALRRLVGKPAAIVSCLEGRWPRRVTVERCAALGEALASLHLAAAGFGLARANALSFAGWRALLERCRGEADAVEPGLEAEIAAELEALARLWPQDLPAGVIHADLFPDNVFFEGDAVTGIIDFYFACDDLLAYDLAVCLNAWCFEHDGAFNLTKAKALLQGYRRRRALLPAEVAALPVLARGSALRFLMTRLHDWLHQVDGALVRPKDPREYLRKLRFHRGVAGPEAYGVA
jgi:homoserine kinase type II